MYLQDGRVRTDNSAFAYVSWLGSIRQLKSEKPAYPTVNIYLNPCHLVARGFRLVLQNFSLSELIPFGMSALQDSWYNNPRSGQSQKLLILVNFS